MKRGVITTVTVFALGSFAAGGLAAEAKGKGETLFKEKCAACHPDGGNVMNAKKTLKKKDLAANKIRNAADLVKYMRNPGPGMTKFDAKALSNKDAKEIASYILKTFK
ncbi:MAG TPA: c-type cytochrome [Geobacteraceae bacterium]